MVTEDLGLWNKVDMREEWQEFRVAQISGKFRAGVSQEKNYNVCMVEIKVEITTSRVNHLGVGDLGQW